MAETLDTTETAEITESQVKNNAGAGSEVAGAPEITAEKITENAEKYLSKALNTGGSKLDDISKVTAERHDGREEKETKPETPAETKIETKKQEANQETKSKGEGLILKLNTAEGEKEFDINNPDQLQQLIASAEDGKLQLEIGRDTVEFDLTSEEGIQELKDALQDSEDTGVTGTDGDLIELKAGEDIEKYDWKKEEDKKKIIEFANKGRFFEKERQAQIKDKEVIEAEKQQVSTFGEAIGHAILFNMSQGKFNEEMLMEKPYEHFLDAVEDNPDKANLSYAEKQSEATKLWNNHKNSVSKSKADIAEFQTNYKKTAEGFTKMITDFQVKHKDKFKDLKEVMDWFGKNVGPYSAPIITYGKEQYPEDMLEMIYFWKNKNTLLAHAKENGARKYAKAKIIKRGSESSITNQNPANKAVTYIRETLQTKGRKIAH